jgi:hypothetical protein
MNLVQYLPPPSFSSILTSVSIVSGYGLDDRPIEVRSPAGAKDFSSSFCVQTSLLYSGYREFFLQG